MFYVPKITAGFSTQRIGSIHGRFVVSKMTLELGYLTTSAFSLINIPKMPQDHTHLSVDEQKTKKCITHSIYWCLIYSYMFRYFKIPPSGSPIWTCWDGALCREKHYAVCHNIPHPSFSACHDIGHHLIMFISDSLMVAFWNAETCKSILSTNTLNEWYIFWSFAHRQINEYDLEAFLEYL
jgi:hypothetical protein